MNGFSETDPIPKFQDDKGYFYQEYLFLFGIPACAQFCQTLILCDITVALKSDKGHMPVQTEVTFQKIRSVSDLELHTI